MKNKINILLFTAIFIASVLPILVSTFVLDEILHSALSFSFNERIHQVIDSASSNLKNLAQFDEFNKEKYKQEFLDLQDLNLIYANGATVRTEIQNSFFLYFVICCGGGLLISVSLSVLVGRRVAKLYGDAHRELNLQREKNYFLESVAQWQEMARRLAHEIKNPLTPIEFSLRNLRKNYAQLSPENFRIQLDETTEIIGEEINHLRNMVQNFSSFARLPEPRPTPTDLRLFLLDFESRFARNWTDLKVVLEMASENPVMVNLDTALFRQALNNLLQNASEANPSQRVDVVIKLSEREQDIGVSVFNLGRSIPKAHLDKIFEPYFSSGAVKENMGLGLAIVRKIIIEQGGDIRAMEHEQGALFEIQFSRLVDRPRGEDLESV